MSVREKWEREYSSIEKMFDLISLGRYTNYSRNNGKGKDIGLGMMLPLCRIRPLKPLTTLTMSYPKSKRKWLKILSFVLLIKSQSKRLKRLKKGEFGVNLIKSVNFRGDLRESYVNLRAKVGIFL